MKNIVRFIILLLLAAGKLSAQCIVTGNCPTDTLALCDYTVNNDKLWADAYWLDPVTQEHDLPDQPVEMSVSVTDDCPGAALDIRYILYLDLDGNGTQETAIRSWALPAAGTVAYNNYNGVQFSAGEVRDFDQRPVTANLKYRFALEETANGSTKTARVRWNTDDTPGTYSDPELPYGIHRIKWLIADGLGNTDSCEYALRLLDCKLPTVVCNSSLSINIMPTGMITLWASDFLQYSLDNHTPSGQMIYAVRKSGAGTGFPVDQFGNPLLSVVFDCSELGSQPIELWARDLAGNADFCQMILTINDDFNFCPANGADVEICANLWCNGATIAGIAYNLGPVSAYDPVTGCATFLDPFLPGGNFTVAPGKDDDPLNGVNTLDLIRVTRHILGLEPLGSPYAMIAADANKSNSITTFDLVEEKKLIQGIYTELPNNTSWRFVDANFLFPNPSNPFSGIIPESFTGNNNTLDTTFHFEFAGIKVGDVDCNAYPGFGQPQTDDRALTALTIPDALLMPGETLEVPVRLAETGSWLGLQFGLQYDPQLLEIESVHPGNLSGMDQSSAVVVRPGLFSLVWFEATPQRLVPADNLVVLRIKARQPVRLSEVLSLRNEKMLPEAYTSGEKVQPLQLRFEEGSAGTAETAFFPAQPNPTAGGATLPLRLDQTGPVTVEVTDVSGQRLWLNQITLNSGIHLLEIPAAALPHPGTYMWRVTAGRATGSGKLVKI